MCYPEHERGERLAEEREAAAAIVGRDRELAALERFVAGDDEVATLVLAGEAGVGKTTLWEAGLDRARRRRLGVLAALPAGAEAQPSFAALADLLAGVDVERLPGVPPPQLRALDVARMRGGSAADRPEPRAIALGLLNVLRAVTTSRPTLVAIDDVGSLDSSSAEALAFAARRLERRTVRFLLTTRRARLTAVEQALEGTGVLRLDVAGLSLGATRQLLARRLGLTLPRRALRRVHESTRGNPLFVLEVGRILAERSPPGVGEEVPVPDTVEDLLGVRVARLEPPVRRALLAVALSGELPVSQLASVVGRAAVEKSVGAAVVVADGHRIRPAHPLLAAATRQQASAEERRELHRQLADVAGDDEVRGLHLALATEAPDADLAAVIAAAAAAAASRGAVEQSVELGEHALRLTPARAPEQGARLLALAEQLVVAGEPERLQELFSQRLATLPHGPHRGRAHLLLADGAGLTIDGCRGHLRHALEESSGDPALRATVLARTAEYAALASVESLAMAERWALDALEEARRANSEVERLALYALAWTRLLRGQSIDDLRERFRSGDAPVHLADSVDRVAAVRLAWRGRVGEARALLDELRRLADERGEAVSYVILGLHQCELELRAGDWTAASRILDEWRDSPDADLVAEPFAERCRALLAAGRGHPDEAERWIGHALAGAEATGVVWDRLEALRARGLAALLRGDPARARESLAPVWEHQCREGVDEPGAFPVAPDLVEALVCLEDERGARDVTGRLQDLAKAQRHPWALAAANRCRGLLLLTSPAGDADEGTSALTHAAAAYEELGLRFDQARTLLVLGRVQRRRRRWAGARRALEAAADAFHELGSTGWEEATRSELARVGARRPRRAGELTPAERRVVELAGQGLANKEIARTLVVSVHTVEVHLSHAYAKLGVRSRAQLARRLTHA